MLHPRWRLAASVLTLTAALGMPSIVAPSPADAAAPPPPLDECLAKGAFRQSDPDCVDHRPVSGSTFGFISSVVRHPVDPGEAITLAIEGVDDLSFDRPILCGEEGCLYHRIAWRVEDRAWAEIVRGCGDRDATCTVRVWPRWFVGDEAERWTVMYGEHFAGRRSVSGVAHAIYQPPRYYPVTLDARTPDGAPVPHEPGRMAYAVRAGTSPTEADCAPEPWVWSRRFDLTTPDPVCVTLVGRPAVTAGAETFTGYLPVDSGEWTIVAQPFGDDGAPLPSRPTPFAPLSVTPTGDDVRATLVEATRPTVRLTVAPGTTLMPIGTIQDIAVTVTAADGVAGGLEGLAFGADTILELDQDQPILELVEILEPVPVAPFALPAGASRTVTARIRAVGLGTAEVGASVAGTDDLGRSVSDAEGGRIVVGIGGEPGPGGADAPQPPEITVAATGESGGRVVGRIDGAPGASVEVLVWTAPPLPDGTCESRVDGPDVAVVGGEPVELGDDGVGTFVLAGALTEGWGVHGVTVASGTSSLVGDCVTVTGDEPVIAIRDTQVTEGTGRGTTDAVVTVTLSEPSDETVTVRASTADGDATSPDDLEALDAVEVVLQPGATEAEIRVAIVADRRPEEDETFEVRLSDPVGARLAPVTTVPGPVATVTILDDDGDAATDLDLRGTWRAVAGDLPRSTRMIIREQSQDGAVDGLIQVDADTRLEIVRGRLQGDRLTLELRNDDITGTLTGRVTRRGGGLQVVLSGRDSSGLRGRVTFRLAGPG